MSEKVYVTAKIIAKPGKGELLERELAAVVPMVRQENGCIRYDLHRELPTTVTGEKLPQDQFLFYEIWRDAAALEAHSQSAHMVKMRDRIKDLQEGHSMVRLYSEVDVAS